MMAATTFDEMVAFARQVLQELPPVRFADSAEHYIVTATPPLIHSDDFGADPLAWLKGDPGVSPFVVDDVAVAAHIDRAAACSKAFDGLQALAAVVLEHKDTLPPSLAAFTVSVLRERVVRPKDPGGRSNRMTDRFRYWWAVRAVSRKFSLSVLGYGGEYTASAVMIVWAAARAEGETTTPEAIANAYKQVQRTLPSRGRQG
jgi:hypothetical protein